MRSEGGLPIGTTPALDDSESRERESEGEKERESEGETERVGRHHVMSSYGGISRDRTD